MMPVFATDGIDMGYSRSRAVSIYGCALFRRDFLMIGADVLSWRKCSDNLL